MFINNDGENMKKVLPGGGTVIGIPKKQVMKFNIVTGFHNLLCIYAITKKIFEIKPLASFSWLIHSREVFCFLEEDQQLAYNIQLLMNTQSKNLVTRIPPLVVITKSDIS